MNTIISPESFDVSPTQPNAATVTLAPGDDEWLKVMGLLDFAQKLEKNNRMRMLLLGAVFAELKRLYRDYCKALYGAGFRKDEISTYSQFKAESGFSIPSNASISNYTKVYGCYCVLYKMATLERQENGLSFSWIDPLLLAAPFELLIFLLRENLHNTADRAREILYNASVMKRSDFWLWLEQQQRVTPVVINPALVDENDPHDKPYQNSLQEVFESYQLAAPEFWKEIGKSMAIPPDVKRPLRLTITIDEIEYGKHESAE